MNILINILIVIAVIAGLIFGSVYALWLLQRKRIMNAIENQNEPKITINTQGGMTEEQVQQMIDEINRRINEEKDQISPELLKAMLQVRTKFQNALKQMRENKG